MKIKDSYALGSLLPYAHENFPLAFDIVATPEVYKFESRRFPDGQYSVKEGYLLHFAYWYSETFGITVWAHSDGSKVQYFTEKPGQPLTSVEPPFPNEGRNLMNTFQGPFSLVLPRKKPHTSKRDEIKHMRILARRRSALLVHIAFLVTGRIERIQNLEHVDLLIEIKDLCIHLYSNKAADGATTSKTPTMDSVSEGKQLLEPSSQDLSQRSPSVVVRGSKRSATAEDEALDHYPPPSKSLSGMRYHS